MLPVPSSPVQYLCVTRYYDRQEEHVMKRTNTPKPLTVKQWRKSLRARSASRAREELQLRMDEFALPPVYRKGATAEIDRRRGTIELAVRTRTVGQHFFPPNIK